MAQLLASGAENESSWLDTSVDRLSHLLYSTSDYGYHRSRLILLGIFLPFAILCLILGAAPITGPWDVAVLLDGGWRIVSGQIPHTDFHNPIGPLAYLLVAFGMKVARPATSSIAYGTVLLMAILLPCSWRTASRRLPSAVAFLVVLFLGFYLVTPRPPGYGIFETTYAMIYNRQAYVLLFLLVLSVFLRPRNPSSVLAWSDGLLVGILLALLLYCKITYFGVALGLTLVGVLLNKPALSWFLSSLAAFLATCAFFFATVHISIYRYFADIIAASRSQSPQMRIFLLSESFANNAAWIYVLLFCAVILVWSESKKRAETKSWAPALSTWLVVASILGAALAIGSGNGSQGGGIDDPLYFAAAVVLLELFRRRNFEKLMARSGMRLAYALSVALMFPMFCGMILARDVASCGYAFAWQIARRPAFDASRRLTSVDLRDFYVPASTSHTTAYWPARDYPEKINDGIALLRQSFTNGDRITTLAYANPFNFALSLPPARDGNVWWDLNFDFDKKHFPPAKEFLGDASLVIVPRLLNRNAGCCFETADIQLQLYGDYLRENFHQIGATETWVLYRRNKAPF